MLGCSQVRSTDKISYVYKMKVVSKNLCERVRRVRFNGAEMRPSCRSARISRGPR
jgi:hypothetical protein